MHTNSPFSSKLVDITWTLLEVLWMLFNRVPATVASVRWAGILLKDAVIPVCNVAAVSHLVWNYYAFQIMQVPTEGLVLMVPSHTQTACCTSCPSTQTSHIQSSICLAVLYIACTRF